MEYLMQSMLHLSLTSVVYFLRIEMEVRVVRGYMHVPPFPNVRTLALMTHCSFFPTPRAMSSLRGRDLLGLFGCLAAATTKVRTTVWTDHLHREDGVQGQHALLSSSFGGGVLPLQVHRQTSMHQHVPRVL